MRRDEVGTAGGIRTISVGWFLLWILLIVFLFLMENGKTVYFWLGDGRKGREGYLSNEVAELGSGKGGASGAYLCFLAFRTTSLRHTTLLPRNKVFSFTHTRASQVADHLSEKRPCVRFFPGRCFLDGGGLLIGFC